MEATKSWQEKITVTCERQGLSPDTDPGRTIATVVQRAYPPDKAGTPRLPLMNVAEGDTTTQAQGTCDMRIRGLLGRGGVARVDLAWQNSLRREVAIKRLLDPESVTHTQMLLREARLCGRLEHPNIVSVHALGKSDSAGPLLVMRRIEGDSWASLLSVVHPANAEWLERHLQILIQVCHAVEFAHDRRIVHRDIKPGNVMVGRFGEVCLVDWGLALDLDNVAPGEESQLVGTPALMAPEMLSRDLTLISPRTDVYLLGATLHALLTGEPRHQGELQTALLAASESLPHTYDRDVPPELAEICNRACSAQARDRFSDAKMFREALVDYLQHSASARLANVTDKRLALLRKLIANSSPGSEQTERAEIRDAFRDCRFGFQQALEEWPENQHAKHGLQSALELMISYELRARNVGSAEALFAFLPSPRPDLERRARTLRAEIAAASSARDELTEMREDMKLEGANWNRSMVLGFGGSFMGLAVFALAQLVRTDIIPGSPELALWLAVGLLSVSMVVNLIFRRSLLNNKAIRRLAALNVIGLAAIIFFDIIAIKLELSFDETVLGGCPVILTAAVALVMLRPELWIAPVATAFLILFGLVMPEYLLTMMSIFLLVFFWYLAWRMRPDPKSRGVG